MARSYVEYDNSLVSDCLRDPSLGCSLTIALWAQFSGRNIVLLSSVKSFITNSGFALYYSNQAMSVYYMSTFTLSHAYTDPLMLTGWNHIAFAYQNTTGTSEVELYINFETVNVEISISPTRTEFVPETFMGSGILGDLHITGFFGVIDELLVFPEFLSASQIAQLKDSSD